jgi:hypothetical protein
LGRLLADAEQQFVGQLVKLFVWQATGADRLAIEAA